MSKIDRTLFDPCSDVKVKALDFGRECQPLLKVDCCMRGVDRLRDYAILEHANFKRSDSYYPGVRLAAPSIYPIAIANSFGKEVSAAFGLNFRNVKKFSSAYSIVTSRPDDLDLLQRIPHFDAPTKNSLAVIHYLSDANHSGTAFYRHNKTDYEYIDALRQRDYMASVRQQFSEPEAQPVGYIHCDTTEYTQIECVDSVYNRLLIYRGSSLHSGMITSDYSFDSSPRTGRLTIATFYEFN